MEKFIVTRNYVNLDSRDLRNLNEDFIGVVQMRSCGASEYECIFDTLQEAENYVYKKVGELDGYDLTYYSIDYYNEKYEVNSIKDLFVVDEEDNVEPNDFVTNYEDFDYYLDEYGELAINRY